MNTYPRIHGDLVLARRSTGNGSDDYVLVMTSNDYVTGWVRTGVAEPVEWSGGHYFPRDPAGEGLAAALSDLDRRVAGITVLAKPIDALT